VERAEIIVMAAGLVLPVIAVPFVVIAQRRLFAVFFAEGVDILGNIEMARKDARVLGALMAKLNALVLHQRPPPQPPAGHCRRADRLRGRQPAAHRDHGGPDGVPVGTLYRRARLCAAERVESSE
jgi:hypothetical protein